MHPFRGEISNKGDFTYPKIAKPRRIICQTTVDDYSNLANQRVTLKDAKTPIWCYLDVVDRAKKEMPGFDPDRQRAILYP